MKIDFENWNRKEIYTHFEGSSNPFYMVTFTVDVTKLYSFVKKHRLSFYYSFIYICTKALNSVENFRYTIRGKEIYLLDKRNPSFTDMKKGSELFHITTVPAVDDIFSFCSLAEEKSQNQSCFLEKSNEGDSLIYFSCSPTLRLTALTNERDFGNPLERESNIPSLAWGKFMQNGDKVELNLSMEVNHRFIDGIHIAKFENQLHKLMEEL